MLWIEAVKDLSADLEEPFELEFVYRGLTNLSKLAWLNLMREEISEKEIIFLTELSKRLAAHEPPQYIVGWAEFCGLRFKVDERVLIPRPETEELVQLILTENSMGHLRVLDIGTGSGAIAVSLAKAHPDWEITATDISDGALELAQENAVKNGVNLDFVKSDVLDNIDEKFDIIVSNPPYIARADENEVDRSVKKFEPDNALFAEHDGLAIYEKIAHQAPAHLTESGKLYCEIGYKQGKAVKKLFEENFSDRTVKIHKDIFDKDRMVSLT
ncbi:peptide chain release factor N(5)-glutamine methyltransferase [Lactococcus nasutitermitis]|uniref:Release factor glutamine methyltransferase n=1 Tax=Lactococcus nasutitermitis TaxID=1652957 RepID=A0ABV9JAI4_9LACT|nr:peptide chain release factor N(5)-glutamine methyltransferase [Lactococcus nasutitermitis]